MNNIIKIVFSVITILFGIFLFIFGGYDDSPGAQGGKFAPADIEKYSEELEIVE